MSRKHFHKTPLGVYKWLHREILRAYDNQSIKEHL